MTPSTAQTTQAEPDSFLGNLQPGSPPVYIPNPYTGVPTQMTMNDNMYWASQALPVQALRGLAAAQGLAAAVALANKLAQEGYAIDYQIMVLGASPTDIMAQRFSVGLTWVPRLDSTDDWTNILANPTAASYDPNKPPADAILVSISGSSYPPIAPPVVPAAPSTAVIGALLPDGNYAPGPGTLNSLGLPNYKLGDTIQNNGHAYQLVQVGLWNSLEWKQLS